MSKIRIRSTIKSGLCVVALIGSIATSLAPAAVAPSFGLFLGGGVFLPETYAFRWALGLIALACLWTTYRVDILLEYLSEAAEAFDGRPDSEAMLRSLVARSIRNVLMYP